MPLKFGKLWFGIFNHLFVWQKNKYEDLSFLVGNLVSLLTLFSIIIVVNGTYVVSYCSESLYLTQA